MMLLCVCLCVPVCGYHMQGLGVVILVFVALYAVFSRILSSSQSTTSAGAGSAGLGLSYTLPIVSALQNLISSFTETEKEMISVERTQEYTDLTSEEDQDGQCCCIVVLLLCVINCV